MNKEGLFKTTNWGSSNKLPRVIFRIYPY